MSTFNMIAPTGSVNGVNSVFTLGTNLPSSAEIYINGQLMTNSADVTLSTATTTGTATATLSFIPSAIPQTGDTILAWIFNQ